MNVNAYKDYADFFIRLIVGFHLIYGTADNVVSWERMLEFRDFLNVHQMFFPLLSAIVSVYAQFLCGLAYIIGFKIRIAASIMIFNFFVAIILVHLDDSYPEMFPALVMLFASIFILLNGSGKLSLDYKLSLKS